MLTLIRNVAALTFMYILTYYLPTHSQNYSFHIINGRNGQRRKNRNMVSIQAEISKWDEDDNELQTCTSFGGGADDIYFMNEYNFVNSIHHFIHLLHRYQFVHLLIGQGDNLLCLKSMYIVRLVCHKV